MTFLRMWWHYVVLRHSWYIHTGPAGTAAVTECNCGQTWLRSIRSRGAH